MNPTKWPCKDIQSRKPIKMKTFVPTIIFMWGLELIMLFFCAQPSKINDNMFIFGQVESFTMVHG